MIQQKNNTTIFHLYSEAANTQWFVKRFEKRREEGDDAPTTFLCRLTAGEKRFT